MKRILALLLMMTVLTCSMALAEAPDAGVTEDLPQTEGTVPEDGADGDTEPEAAQYVWYPDNTACAFGPQIPGSWQTCAVVDLSADGEQTFDLVAAGAWKIGTVTVMVNGDEVTVTYGMTEDRNTRDTWDDITVDAEYLNIFSDVASVDRNADSAYAFGTPISIAADLGGDTVVAVYVRLQVDYPAPMLYVTRFWENLKENAAIVEAMNALLEE